MTERRPIVALLALALAACGSDPAGPAGASETGEAQEPPADAAGAALPGDDSTRPYDGIAPDETLRFTGNEPFWGGEVTGKALVYKTPENQDGTVYAVERFAGRGGISFSGMAEHPDFEMTVTPLACSDGMSDRTYPFTVTLNIDGELRNGCGWTDRRPFEGSEHP